MSSEALNALKVRVEAAEDVDEDLLRDAAEEMRKIFPRAPMHPERLSDSTEAVLRLVDHCLPGWTVTLRGTATEPDGHWHCSLRSSGSDDDDAVIGHGNAPTVSAALLRALVATACIKA